MPKHYPDHFEIPFIYGRFGDKIALHF